TARYGIPHGIAVAVTLPLVLEYNSQGGEQDCVDPRGPRHVQQRLARICDLLGAKDTGEARDKVKQIIRSIDCPTSLSELGIVEEAPIRELAAQASVERLGNNPRLFAGEQLVELLLESAVNIQVTVVGSENREANRGSSRKSTHAHVPD